MPPWQPPESGNLPEQGKEILRKVYNKCRDAHPQETDEWKTRCAKIAWSAVHKAGYKKEGDNWTKSTEPDEDIKDMTDDEIISFTFAEDFDGAKLSYQERKKLPESTFCGPDRSYPVPDLAHVRNALARLHFAPPSQRKSIHDCIIRKAKSLGWGEEEMERHKKDCPYHGTIVVALEKITAKQTDKNKFKIRPTKVGAYVYSETGIAYKMTEKALAECSHTWINGTVGVNHKKTKHGIIIDSKFVSPFVEQDVIIDNEESAKRIAGGEASGLVGLSIEANATEVDEEKKEILKFEGTGVTFVFYPEEPSCKPTDGCQVIGGEMEKVEFKGTETKDVYEVVKGNKTYRLMCLAAHNDIIATKQAEIDELTKQVTELKAFRDNIENERRNALKLRIVACGVDFTKYQDLSNEKLSGIAEDLEKAKSEKPQNSGAQEVNQTPQQNESGYDYESTKQKEQEALGFKKKK